MSETLAVPVDEIAGRVSGHWIQGRYAYGDSVCLHGGVHVCCTEPGDQRLVSAVLNYRGYMIGWNDDRDRTEPGVLVGVRELPTGVLPDELVEVFGPRWSEIVALVRRCAVLTLEDGAALVAARDAARDAAQFIAQAAAQDGAQDGARVASWGAALSACWGASLGAARDAARALVVRDRIGRYGFTQDHYDTLTGLWRRVIGPLHADDAAIDNQQEEQQ